MHLDWFFVIIYCQTRGSIYLSYTTNIFHVAMDLYSNKLQKMSKCGKNVINDTLDCASCVTFLFLPHDRILIL